MVEENIECSQSNCNEREQWYSNTSRSDFEGLELRNSSLE